MWTVGITVRDTKYRYALVNMVLDGCGLEKVRNRQGAGCHAGCTHCFMEGRTLKYYLQYTQVTSS